MLGIDPTQERSGVEAEIRYAQSIRCGSNPNKDPNPTNRQASRQLSECEFEWAFELLDHSYKVGERLRVHLLHGPPTLDLHRVFGWIEPGASMTTGSEIPLFNVSRFWEKPPLATAHQLMKTGGLWNTFVTIGYGSAFLKLLTGTVPSAVSEISKALTKGDPDAAYRDMGSIDFSKHVLSQD
jgi:mannose-1-phosphate guanylyltransferase